MIRRLSDESEAVPCIYQVGLVMFGTVFGLSTSDAGIRRPEPLESATMIIRKEITDFLTLSIGGVHNLAHNLAFIPKNQDFNTFQGDEYSNPMVVRYYFMQLGYGRQMSAALCERAAHMLLSSETATLQGTLNSLIQAWNNVSDRNMIPLTLLKGIQATRPEAGIEGDSFLILHNGRVFIARSGKNISKNLTVGFNTGIAKAAVGISMTDKEIERQSEVKSMFDAVAHLYSRQPKLDKGGLHWYKPRSSVMSEITGALTLLSVILTGKVKPFGKFMHVVPEPKCPAEFRNAVFQDVCFNLPISYGLAYMTFARECLPESTNGTVLVGDFCTVGVERWDRCFNYSYPVVVGGPRDDEAVRSAVFSVEVELLPDAETYNRLPRDLRHSSMLSWATGLRGAFLDS